MKSKELFFNKFRNIGRQSLKTFLRAIRSISNRLPISLRHRLIPGFVLKLIHERTGNNNRIQRVYLKNGIGPVAFLKKLNEKKVEYVLLRWWENLPDYPPGEDVNILVKDEHRDFINDLVSNYDSRGVKCDIYTVRGSKNGSRYGIPVFSSNLSLALLREKMLFNEVFVPSPLTYFASVAYHAILHKGHNSGVPGFEMGPTKYVYNYSAALRKMALDLDINVDITVTGLFNWLKQEGFAPADDTLSKLVENRPELSLLETRLFSDARGGNLLVYVVRERMLQDGFLYDFKGFLEDKFEFDILDVRILNAEEKEICSRQIRGGKWDKGPFQYSGGPPVAFVVAFDYQPEPLSEIEQENQPRTTNKNIVQAKYDFRKRTRLTLKDGFYNGLHSPDNEQDAWFYISQIGKDYSEKINRLVEARRERYSKKWAVKKVLATGQISKVELIKYAGGFAVKKTFRPGKERFFKRELFAVKELSKELSFIPPLLEEGDGYVVIPYFKNILENLSEKEKKQVIASKANEIGEVIREMHLRGLIYINFTPASIIITPDNKLYCTGFTYLQKYSTHTDLEHAFELVGLPKTFEGDQPEGFNQNSISFSNIWSPYLSLRQVLQV